MTKKNLKKIFNKHLNNKLLPQILKTIKFSHQKLTDKQTEITKISFKF